MKSALKDAIKLIEKAGFSHIKVELEANLERTGEADCWDCDSSGSYECSRCYGHGSIEVDEDNYEECGDCDGVGTIDCESCYGHGYSSDWSDETDCQDFIESNVSDKAQKALVYGKFYNDGSVDSEYTFTVSVKDVEVVTEYIQAFQDLADRIGNGMDTDGAGMHIAVLPKGCNGEYPSDIGYDYKKYTNFRKQIFRLLPALYFLGSSSSRSRGLEYRIPRISNEDKYSAIFVTDSAFEYRVFETCYHKPEIFFDYVEVIANTLKFYDDDRIQAKQLNQSFGWQFYGDGLDRFFGTEEQLRVLNSQIKILKPRDKTIKQLKKERGVSFTIRELKRQEVIKRTKLRQEYRQIKRRVDEQKKAPVSESEQRDIDRLVLDGEAPDRALERVRRIARLEPLQDFINKNLTRISYDMTTEV